MKHSSILLLLFFNLFLLGNAVQRKRALLEGNIKITTSIYFDEINSYQISSTNPNDNELINKINQITIDPNIECRSGSSTCPIEATSDGVKTFSFSTQLFQQYTVTLIGFEDGNTIEQNINIEFSYDSLPNSYDKYSVVKEGSTHSFAFVFYSEIEALTLLLNNEEASCTTDDSSHFLCQPTTQSNLYSASIVIGGVYYNLSDIEVILLSNTKQFYSTYGEVILTLTSTKDNILTNSKISLSNDWNSFLSAKQREENNFKVYDYLLDSSFKNGNSSSIYIVLQDETVYFDLSPTIYISVFNLQYYFGTLKIQKTSEFTFEFQKDVQELERITLFLENADDGIIIEATNYEYPSANIVKCSFTLPSKVTELKSYEIKYKHYLDNVVSLLSINSFLNKPLVKSFTPKTIGMTNNSPEITILFDEPITSTPLKVEFIHEDKNTKNVGTIPEVSGSVSEIKISFEPFTKTGYYTLNVQLEEDYYSPLMENIQLLVSQNELILSTQSVVLPENSSPLKTIYIQLEKEIESNQIITFTCTPTAPSSYSLSENKKVIIAIFEEGFILELYKTEIICTINGEATYTITAGYNPNFVINPTFLFGRGEKYFEITYDYSGTFSSIQLSNSTELTLDNENHKATHTFIVNENDKLTFNYVIADLYKYKCVNYDSTELSLDILAKDYTELFVNDLPTCGIKGNTFRPDMTLINQEEYDYINLRYTLYKNDESVSDYNLDVGTYTIKLFNPTWARVDPIPLYSKEFKVFEMTKCDDIIYWSKNKLSFNIQGEDVCELSQMFLEVDGLDTIACNCRKINDSLLQCESIDEVDERYINKNIHLTYMGNSINYNMKSLVRLDEIDLDIKVFFNNSLSVYSNKYDLHYIKNITVNKNDLNGNFIEEMVLSPPSSMANQYMQYMLISNINFVEGYQYELVYISDETIKKMINRRFTLPTLIVDRYILSPKDETWVPINIQIECNGIIIDREKRLYIYHDGKETECRINNDKSSDSMVYCSISISPNFYSWIFDYTLQLYASSTAEFVKQFTVIKYSFNQQCHYLSSSEEKKEIQIRFVHLDTASIVIHLNGIDKQTEYFPNEEGYYDEIAIVDIKDFSEGKYPITISINNEAPIPLGDKFVTVIDNGLYYKYVQSFSIEDNIALPQENVELTIQLNEPINEPFKVVLINANNKELEFECGNDIIGQTSLSCHQSIPFDFEGENNLGLIIDGCAVKSNEIISFTVGTLEEEFTFQYNIPITYNQDTFYIKAENTYNITQLYRVAFYSQAEDTILYYYYNTNSNDLLYYSDYMNALYFYFRMYDGEKLTLLFIQDNNGKKKYYSNNEVVLCIPVLLTNFFVFEQGKMPDEITFVIDYGSEKLAENYVVTADDKIINLSRTPENSAYRIGKYQLNQEPVSFNVRTRGEIYFYINVITYNLQDEACLVRGTSDIVPISFNAESPVNFYTYTEETGENYIRVTAPSVVNYSISNEDVSSFKVYYSQNENEQRIELENVEINVLDGKTERLTEEPTFIKIKDSEWLLTLKFEGITTNDISQVDLKAETKEYSCTYNTNTLIVENNVVKCTIKELNNIMQNTYKIHYTNKCHRSTYLSKTIEIVNNVKSFTKTIIAKGAESDPINIGIEYKSSITIPEGAKVRLTTLDGSYVDISKTYLLSGSDSQYTFNIPKSDLNAGEYKVKTLISSDENSIENFLSEISFKVFENSLSLSSSQTSSYIHEHLPETIPILFDDKVSEDMIKEISFTKPNSEDKIILTKNEYSLGKTNSEIDNTISLIPSLFDETGRYTIKIIDKTNNEQEIEFTIDIKPYILQLSKRYFFVKNVTAVQFTIYLSGLTTDKPSVVLVDYEYPTLVGLSVPLVIASDSDIDGKPVTELSIVISQNNLNEKDGYYFVKIQYSDGLQYIETEGVVLYNYDITVWESTIQIPKTNIGELIWSSSTWINTGQIQSCVIKGQTQQLKYKVLRDKLNVRVWAPDENEDALDFSSSSDSSITLVVTDHLEKTYEIVYQFTSALTVNVSPTIITSADTTKFKFTLPSGFSYEVFRKGDETHKIDTSNYSYTPTKTEKIRFQYIIEGKCVVNFPSSILILVDDFNDIFNPNPECIFLYSFYEIELSFKNKDTSLQINDFRTELYRSGIMNALPFDKDNKYYISTFDKYTIKYYFKNTNIKEQTITVISPTINNNETTVNLLFNNTIKITLSDCGCIPDLSKDFALYQTGKDEPIQMACYENTNDGIIDCFSNEPFDNSKYDLSPFTFKYIDTVLKTNIELHIDIASDIQPSIEYNLKFGVNTVTLTTTTYNLNNVISVTLHKRDLYNPSIEIEEDTITTLNKINEHSLTFEIDIKDGIEYTLYSVNDNDSESSNKIINANNIWALPFYSVQNKVIFFDDNSKSEMINIEISLNGNTIENELSITIEGVQTQCTFINASSDPSQKMAQCSYSLSDTLTTQIIKLVPAEGYKAIDVQLIKFYSIHKKCFDLTSQENKSETISFDNQSGLKLYGSVDGKAEIEGKTNAEDESKYDITFDTSSLKEGKYYISVKTEQSDFVTLSTESFTILGAELVKISSFPYYTLPLSSLTMKLTMDSAFDETIYSFTNPKLISTENEFTLECTKDSENNKLYICNYNNEVAIEKIGEYSLTYELNGCTKTSGTSITFSDTVGYTLTYNKPTVSIIGSGDLTKVTKINFNKKSSSSSESETVLYCKSLEIDTNCIVFDSQTETEIVITIERQEGEQYTLSLIQDEDGHDKYYQEKEYVLADFELITDVIVLDENTNEGGVAVDFIGLNLVQDKLYLNGDDSKCTKKTVDNDNKTKYTFTCQIDTKPSAPTVKLSSDESENGKTFNIVKYQFTNDDKCIVVESNQDIIEVTFTSSSSLSLNVFIGDSTTGKSVQTTLSNGTYTGSLSISGTDLSTEGTIQLYANKVDSINEKELLPNSEINVHRKITITADPKLKMISDNEYLLTLKYESISTDDLTQIDLKLTENNNLVSKFTCSIESTTLVIENNVVKCTIQSSIEKKTYKIYYTNICGRDVYSNRDVANLDKVTSLSKKVIKLSSESSTVSIDIDYQSLITIPENTFVRLVSLDGSMVDQSKTYILSGSGSHYTISIPKEDLPYGEYKIKTLLVPNEEDHDDNFLSEINILIVENTMSLVSGQSITYTRENTPQVINVNFTDIIIPEQIKEVSLSGSLLRQESYQIIQNDSGENKILSITTDESVSGVQFAKGGDFALKIVDRSNSDKALSIAIKSYPIITSIDNKNYNLADSGTNYQVTLTLDAPISTIQSIELYNVDDDSLVYTYSSSKLTITPRTSFTEVSFSFLNSSPAFNKNKPLYLRPKLNYETGYSYTYTEAWGFVFYMNQVEVISRNVTMPRTKAYSILVPLNKPIISGQLYRCIMHTERDYDLQCGLSEDKTTAIFTPKKEQEHLFDFSNERGTIWFMIQDIFMVYHDVFITCYDPPSITISPTFIMGKEPTNIVFTLSDNSIEIYLKSDLNNKIDTSNYVFTPTETVVLSFLYKADTGFFEISTQVKVIADDFNSLFNEIISCWFSAIEYSVDLTMKKEIESLSPNDFETKIYLLNDNQNELQKTNDKYQLSDGEYIVKVYYNSEEFYSKELHVFTPIINNNLMNINLNDDQSISITLTECSCLPEIDSFDLKQEGVNEPIVLTCTNANSQIECISTFDDTKYAVSPFDLRYKENVLKSGLIVYKGINKVTDLTATIENVKGGKNIVSVSTNQYDLNNIVTVIIKRKDLLNEENELESIIITKEEDSNPFTVVNQSQMTFEIFFEENIQYSIQSISDKYTTLDITEGELWVIPTYEVTSKMVFFNAKTDNVMINITIKGETNENTISVSIEDSKIECTDIVDEATITETLVRNIQCIYPITESTTSQILKVLPGEGYQAKDVQLIKYELLTEQTKCFNLPLTEEKKTTTISFVYIEGLEITLKIKDKEAVGEINSETNLYEVSFDISGIEEGKHYILFKANESEYRSLNGEYITIIGSETKFTLSETIFTLPLDSFAFDILFDSPLNKDIYQLSDFSLVKGEDKIDLQCSIQNDNSSIYNCQCDTLITSKQAGEYTLYYHINRCKKSLETSLVIESGIPTYSIKISEPIVIGENILTINGEERDDLTKVTKVLLKKTNIQGMTETIIYCGLNIEDETCVNRFATQTSEEVSMRISIEEGEQYELLSIDNTDNVKINFNEKEYVLSDYQLKPSFVIIDESIKQIEIAIDFFGLNLIKDTIYVDREECSNREIDSEIKTKYLFTCQIKSMPSDIKITLSTNANETSKTISIVKYEFNDKGCSIVDSDDDNVNIIFTSISSISFNLSLGESDKTIEATTTQEGESYKAIVSFTKDDFINSGEYYVYYSYNENKKLMLQNSKINVYNKVEVNSVSSTIVYINNEYSFNIYFDSITTDDVTEIELKLNEETKYLSSSLKLEQNTVQCVITNPIEKGIYSVYYTNICGRQINTNKQVAYRYDKVLSIDKTFINLSEESDLIQFNIEYLSTIIIPESAAIQLTNLDGTIVDSEKTYPLTGSNSHYTFTIPKNDIKQGEYKILTLLFNENEENFLSEINIKIISGYLQLVPEQNIKFIQGNIPEVISIKFVNEIFSDQIKSISIASSNQQSITLPSNSYTIDELSTTLSINTEESGVSFDDIDSYIVTIVDNYNNDKEVKLIIRVTKYYSIDKIEPELIILSDTTGLIDITITYDKELPIDTVIQFKSLSSGEYIDTTAIIKENKAIISLTPSNEETYNIKTIFSDSIYTFETDYTQVIKIRNQPLFLFDFNRFYYELIDGEPLQLEITVKDDTNNEVNEIFCYDESIVVTKESNSLFKAKINKAGRYSFTYTTNKEGDTRFSIDSIINVYAKGSEIVSFSSGTKECNYYLDDYLISIIFSNEIEEKDKQRFSVYYVETLSTEKIELSKDANNYFSIPQDKKVTLQGEEVTLIVVENNDLSHPLVTKKVTFSDLTVPVYVYKDKKFKFTNAICDLSTSSLTLSSEINTIVLSSCEYYNDNLICSFETTPTIFGIYKSKINNFEIADVFISNTFKDTSFIVNYPEHFSEKDNLINITNPDFYMPKISSISISKEGEVINDYKFSNENNVISITIDTEENINYAITSITKEKEENETDEDIVRTFTDEYIFAYNTFIIETPYIFTEPNQQVSFTIIPKKDINALFYSSSFDGSGSTPCTKQGDKFLCVISNVQREAVYYFISEGCKTQKGYVVVYSFDNTQQCQTIIKDSTNTVLSLSINTPNDFPFKIDSSMITFGDLSVTNNNNKYSFIDDKDSLPIEKNKVILKLDKNNVIELGKEFSFYTKYAVSSTQSLLLQRTSNQDIILTFSSIDNTDNISVDFSSLTNPNKKISSICTVINTNEYKCSLDLESISEGQDYVLSYTSQCGDIIILKENIIVYSKTTLPIQPAKTTTYSIGDTLIIRNSDVNNKDVAIYIKKTNSIEFGAPILTQEWPMSITLDNVGEFELYYAFSDQFSKIMISLFKVEGEITVSPQPSSCYYNKETLSFTISNANVYGVLINKETNEEVALSINNNRITLNFNNEHISSGTYKIMIYSNINNRIVFSSTIVVTDILLNTYSFEDSIKLSSLSCIPSTLLITKGRQQNSLQCDSTIIDGSITCKSEYKLDEYGIYTFYVNDILIGNSFISNSLADSKFTIVNPEMISVDIELVYYLTSKEYYLPLIKKVHYQIKEKGSDDTKEQILDCLYNETSNQISFTLQINDLKNEYVLSSIESDNAIKELSHILSEKRSCFGDLLMLPNGTCILPDEDTGDSTIDKCLDYCKNGAICSIENNAPTCNCTEGYYGMQCTLSNDTVNTTITNSVNELFTPKTEEGNVPEPVVLDLKQPEIAIQIKTLNTLVNQDPVLFINNIDNTQRTNLVKSAAKTVEVIIKQANNQNKKVAPSKSSMELIKLAVVVEVNYLLSKLTGLRNLQEDISNLKELLVIVHDLNVANINAFEDKDNFASSVLVNHMIGYQLFRNNREGIEKYNLYAQENSYPIVTFSDCIGMSETFITAQTTFGKDVMRALGEEGASDSIKLSGYNTEKGSQYNLNKCESMKVEMTMSNYRLNSDLYKYYNERGIDIYNPNDKAFTDSCYVSKKFDYDLTQKYRRKNVYQGYTFKPVDGCTYEGLVSNTNRIIFNCTSVPEQMYYSLEKTNLKEIDVNHVDNLPTKCPSDIDDIKSNIAFWLYIVMFVIAIFFNVMLFTLSCNKNNDDGIDKAITNDELEDSKIVFEQVIKTEHVQTEEIKKDNENKPIKSSDVKISIPSKSNKSFGTIFFNNFKSLHPLFSLCHQSILSPMLFTSWVFLYNVLNLFGFNALYFNETMIEDRIYDKHRDNFGYPMKTEFEKIMAAISTCIALTIVVRLITLVTDSQKIRLIQQLKVNKDRVQIISEFNKSMLLRRIIAGVFMLALNVFFFYYCVVFCGIYVNAQYGWFYSGIWSLFFNWIVYAPLYILIISAVESSGKESCAYYMKRLFVF